MITDIALFLLIVILYFLWVAAEIKVLTLIVKLVTKENQLSQVDDLLVCSFIVAVDGDYTTAIRRLINHEIQLYDDPNVSEVANERRERMMELAELRMKLGGN